MMDKKGFICIAPWQTETVRHKDCVFTFSPFGLGKIDGWILMSWQRTKTCDMGHHHGVEFWHHHTSMFTKPLPVPHIPRAIWRALARKTKNVKKLPWPGND